MLNMDAGVIELLLLSPNAESPVSDAVGEIVQYACRGKYIKCFGSCMEKFSFLRFDSSNLENLGKDVTEYILGMDAAQELEIFACGISCLQLFVICNWTGPAPNDLSLVWPENNFEQLNKHCLQYLEVNRESIYGLVASPIFLYVAKCIFEAVKHSNCKTCAWWFLRYINIHQQLLNDRSTLFHEQSNKLIAEVVEQDYLSLLENRSNLIQFHLEAGLIKLFYYQYKECQTHFETAKNLTGLQCSFDGVPGVRTRFQQHAIAQLRIKIEKMPKEIWTSKVSVASDAGLPQALPLNDDTVLEAVKYTDGNELIVPDLNCEEQAIVLMMCTHMQRAFASNKLKDEETKCILEYLILNPKCWAIQAEALRIRSRVEKGKSRTIERSMMQLETLVKDILPKDIGTDCSEQATGRLNLFYSVSTKPIWILQKNLAALFESLGAISSALEIYERLQMWEDAIICLIRTGRGHKAEMLIRKQLEIKETPTLYCLLGDILEDPTLYEKAWEISNHFSSRAMRSLGAYKISKKMYVEAMECFEKSTQINYLQASVWFNMGCAALACEQYEKAAKAFQKCVNLNWDNFQAWSNLSTAFVRCNKKIQAYRTIQEAIKCNFDRWELWENLLFISVDIGQFGETIQAYTRLLDVKDKYVDIQVLEILVKAINEDLLDADSNSSSRLKSKALKLFGRITSKTTNNWEIWNLYARLIGNGTKSEDSEENMKALIYLQKALRSLLQTSSWEKDEESVKKMTVLCDNLMDACAYCNGFEKNNAELKKTLTSVRLAVNSVLTKLKLQEKQILDIKIREEFSGYSKDLQEKLKILTDTLGQAS